MALVPTTAMREGSVLCQGPHGLHRMAYTEWGDPGNPQVLVCVHGLTRTGRDFDFLAHALSGRYRVVCPDVPGRGRSDWLDVKDDYVLPVYVNDMVTLIARLGVATVDWLGTSMGGLIGMGLACQPNAPVRKLVLNDVGPVISAESLQRIAAYIGHAPTFADLREAERYIRAVAAPFGPLNDEQWRHLAEHSVRPRPEGGLTLHYDPGLAEPFRKAVSDELFSAWPMYDPIRCPTLVVRGEQSDLLTREAAREMAERGPRAKVVEVPGVGHAPTFLDDAQVALVRNFLLDQ